MKRKITGLLLVASVLAISACSTVDKEQNARLDSMQKEISELRQMNEQTTQRVTSVEQTATTAKSLAEDVSVSTQKTQQTAEDANERTLKILDGLRSIGR